MLRGGEVVATYKVIFLGLTVAGTEEEGRLVSGLQKKFNLSTERAERLLQKVPIVVKKGIPKEEMERYLKAFEEIGGRVRVEEEIPAEGPPVQQPEPPWEQPSPRPKVEGMGNEPSGWREPAPEPEMPPRVPPPEKGAYTGNMVTCPQCGFEQPETDECIKCGIVISKFLKYREMAKMYEGQVREVVAEEKASPSWESGEGFFGAFFKTTQEVLFSPSEFFKKVASTRGYWTPLIYGVICGVIGACVTVLWQWLFASRLLPIPALTAIPFFSIFVFVFLIGLPFMIAFSILVGSCITHLCLMIVGGNKNGFESTFRGLSYAYGGNLFGVIPFVGSTIGGIYTLILTIFGIREGHGISTGRAVLAVLLPLLVLMGLGIVAVMLLPFLIGSSLRFLGGARI